MPKKTVGLDVTAHARNFFDCIKSRERDGGQSTGHAPFAHRVSRGRFILDSAIANSSSIPKKEVFIDDDEANSLRSRPARDPWSV